MPAAIEPASDWYPGESRQERLVLAIARNGFDVLVALTPENAAWLSGRTSTIATLWRVPGLVAVAVNADGEMAVATGDNEAAAYDGVAHVFTHPLWIEHLDLATLDCPLAERVAASRPGAAISRPAQYEPERMLAAMAEAIRAVSPSPHRLGTELAALPIWVVEGLRARMPRVELLDATPIFSDLRAIKDDKETAHLRCAAELTEIGIAAARDTLRPGLAPIAVSAAYQRAIWAAAATEPRFAAMRQAEGLVTVGDGRHAVTVGPGETVKLDMQVDVGGYHSDVGRTYAIAPTPQQRQVYDALAAALDTAVRTIAPGVPFRDVWHAGTVAMRDAGFANYSRGHLGHSDGLAHNYEEPPFIAADETRPIVPGMVLSVELPYYLRGLGSFQMERMVVIDESGAELLDHLPFEFDPCA